jgi:drug/metabolite transporter (DMT)-like permease
MPHARLLGKSNRVLFLFASGSFTGKITAFMWIAYAIAASICWGMSYAASGPLLKKGFSPLLFFFGYTLFGLLGATISLLCSGRFSCLWKFPGLERSDTFWFFFSIATGALGAYLTYVAMGAKNPTLASLIEISYPFFVVLFAWLFFREMQLNVMTLCGGILVLAGVAVILIGER